MNTPKLEISKTLVVSTGHIQKEDDTTINKLSESNKPYNITILDYGYIVSTNLAGLKLQQGVRKLSTAFFNILNLASLIDCDYVKFDCDGPYIDGYKTFKW